MKKSLICLLTILLLTGLCACKSESNDPVDETVVENSEASKEEEKVVYKSNLTVDKQETVNVKTDANGNAYETCVEVDLKNPLDGQPIQDKTTLKDIVNTESDETYTTQDDYIYWSNAGEDIHYKGYSDESLPISVKITYYLDGQEMKPEDLAHASGHVKIRFDYVNNTKVVSKVNGVSYTVKIPFVCLTMLYLPSDNFYNVESEDGEIMNMDDSILIIGTGFPGLQDSLKLNGTDFTKNVDLKDYFEVEADVSDFELDYTATLASNGLLKDLEDKDLKDIDDMLDEVDDIDDQKADIEDSKDDLEDASKQFSNLVDQLAGYITTLNGYATDMYQNMDEVLPLLVTKMSDLNGKIDPDYTKKALVNSSAGIYSFNVITDTEYETKKKTEIDYYTDQAANGTSDEIKNAAASALKIANYYYASMDLIAYSSGFVSKFNASSVKSSVVDSFDELIDVLDDFEDNIDDLTEDMDSGLRETVNRLKATRNIDKEYNNFSGIVDGKEGSVVFIYQSDEVK